MSALEGPTAAIRGRILLGDDREAAEIWVRGGRVSLTRPSAQGTNMRVLEGWAVPGLVDVHCHIGLAADGAVPDEEAEKQAVADRDAGVLLIRDAGSPLDTAWVHRRSDLPYLLRSGTHLALRKRYLRNYGLELESPEQLPEAVRAQARRGDGWVKLVGDWIDRSLGADPSTGSGRRGDLRPLWPDDLLTEAVAVAHAEAARVTVHAFAEETIDGLLAAGVDCIEHGTGMTADHMAVAAERGIAVTPTLLQVGQFENIAAQADGKYPVYAERMRRMHANRYQQVRDLHEAGVRLLVGTDAGGTISHGRIADECAELVAAGIPASEVVAMASWRARDYLGFGAVVEGSSADFVVYPADPREDIEVLRHPTAIVLRGVVYPTTR